MKIVDVCAFYSPQGGGVKTYVERKLAAGPALGHEVVVIAPGEENNIEERGMDARIVTLKARHFPLDTNYFYFNDLAVLHAAISAEMPDILEASSPWRSPSMTAKWHGNAPRALIMHSDPLSAYAYRWFGRILERPTIDRHFEWFWRHLRRLDAQYDAVICANSDLANRLIEGGLTKVVTNPMGVEAGLFSPSLRNEELRTRLLARCALGPKATLLVGVGRHAPEKRWPMVIDAVATASHTHPVGLVLLGDGRERKKIVRHANGNPHVQFLTPLSDRKEIATLLASCDAMIHGCEAETFGMAAAEALASGIPLIAPDRGGVSDQARGAGCQLYTANSSVSASAAIIRLINLGRDTARAATTLSAPYVRTMDQHFVDLFAHYQSLKEAPALRVA